MGIIGLLLILVGFEISLTHVSALAETDKLVLYNASLKTEYSVSEYGVKIESEVYRVLREKNQTRIIVILKYDFLPEKLSTRKEKVRGLQRQVLSQIPDFTLIHRYESFAALSGLATPEVIKALEKLPLVERVYMDRIAKTALTESVPLINATAPWSQGYSGRNQGILVVDTGVDYRHAALGNPNCTISTSVDGGIQTEILESPHPYPNYYDYTWTITKPGFESIAVHFANVSVEKSYDFVYVMDAGGNIIESYTGNYTNKWSLSVPGSTIKIRLKTDSSITGYGFYIDKVLNGSVKTSFVNCGRVRGGYDFVNHDSDPMDDNGHGTHVAGIAASSDTTYRGVAPEASIIAAKVLDSTGNGYFSDVAAAVDWGINNKDDYNVSVISMSLGDGGEYNNSAAQCDPYATAIAINTAFQQGIFVAVASGNEGYTNGISYPACASNATSVGAVYDADVGRKRWGTTCTDATTYADKIVCFTNRDEILDILAPGSVITSTIIGGGFGDKSGTSMATPHLSGVAALMKSKNPSLTPQHIRDKIKATGKDVYDAATGLTFKRVDASEAIDKAGYDYAAKAVQAMQHVTSASNSYVDQGTGLLWSNSFTGDLANAAPCYDGSYFYHTARAVMGERATGVRTDLADVAVNRVFVENYRENGTWGYPHEPWFGRMGYPNNNGNAWPNNSLYEDIQAWQSAENMLIAAKELAVTGVYNAYVERMIDGIIQQSVSVKGGYMYNSTTGALQYYNGSAWVPAPRHTAQFVSVLKLVNPVKYSSQIGKGSEYLDANTLSYLEANPQWQAFLVPYFLSAHALLGNQSMVNALFSEYVSKYGDGVNFTHEIQLTHAGNASVNSILYHASGLNAMVSAYNATGNLTYSTWAREIADHMLTEHWNSSYGYFTNLNAPAGSSNYCNYQKGLAEMNGVGAYALMKLAKVSQATANSSVSLETTSDTTPPSIQIKSKDIADYMQFRIEAWISASRLKNVAFLQGSKPLAYSTSGNFYSTQCIGPYPKGTLLNFTVVAEDVAGNIAKKELGTVVEEGEVKIEGSGRLEEGERDVKIELQTQWKNSEAKGELQLVGGEGFKLHGKIGELYKDCNGVFNIAGVAKIETGKSKKEDALFTGKVTEKDIRIAVDKEEFFIPAKAAVKETRKGSS